LFARRFFKGGTPKPIHACTLQRWRRARLLPFVKVNARTYIYPADKVDALLQEVATSGADVVELSGFMRLKRMEEVRKNMEQRGIDIKKVVNTAKAMERKKQLSKEVADDLHSYTRQLEEARIFVGRL
jgi:hypothetical protein